MNQHTTYALITGASSGIGKHIAMVLAGRKNNVLLVARNEKKLSETAAFIRKEYDVPVDFLAIDLAEKESPSKVFQWTQEKNYRISILVNNAAQMGTAVFESSEDKYIDELIMVNIRTLVFLSRYFIPDMKKMEEAYILNVGSLSAWYSIPFKSMYAASKAFVLNFSRALHTELKDSCIRISVLSPNGVETNTGTRKRIAAHGRKGFYTSVPVEKVAEIAVNKMFRKKFMIIPGFINRMILGVTLLTPKVLQQRFLYREFFREKESVTAE